MVESCEQYVSGFSGTAEKPSEKYIKAAKLASALAPKVHYTVDEKQKSILITDDGYEAAEDVLEVRYFSCWEGG